MDLSILPLLNKNIELILMLACIAAIRIGMSEGLFPAIETGCSRYLGIHLKSVPCSDCYQRSAVGGFVDMIILSRKRESDSRPPSYQDGVLPLNYSGFTSDTIT